VADVADDGFSVFLPHLFGKPGKEFSGSYVLGGLVRACISREFTVLARHSLHQTAEGWSWKFDPLVFRRVAPRAAHEILPKVRCRLALFRAQFGMVTPDIGDFMYELLDRNAPVVEIPQCYHHMMLDQPLALVSAFRTLLADWEHSVPRRRR